MYNHMLHTFIAVADCSSFTKAAERLYISPTAVMKQMNTLEQQLHLVPFEDNHEGILCEMKQRGKKFDFLIGVCDSKAWLNLCNFLPLGRVSKMIAVSGGMRLFYRVPYYCFPFFRCNPSGIRKINLVVQSAVRKIIHIALFLLLRSLSASFSICFLSHIEFPEAVKAPPCPQKS